MDLFKNHITHLETNQIKMKADEGFVPWLKKANLSIAMTTYQAGKLIFFGVNEQDQLSIFNRNFERCMALHWRDETIYLSSLFQVWAFQNVLQDSADHEGHDRLYVPHISWVTGDVDIHCLAEGPHGKPIFVNTLFSCICEVSDTKSFVPLWKPDFISRLAAEDRCHMNGMALENGVPRYISAVSQTDTHEGWRDHRADGGVVIDIQSNDVVCGGLSMPHTPTVHDGKLFLLQSGTGEFGYIDLDKGGFEPLIFCPGFLRGLAFHGDKAVVGVSMPRKNKTFSGLPLDEKLEKHKMEPACAILVLNIKTKKIEHALWFEGAVDEIYDVAVMPGVKNAAILSADSEEIRRIINMGETPEGFSFYKN